VVVLSTGVLQTSSVVILVVAKHLAGLKAVGFVTERREGRSRILRADPAALGSLRAAIEDHWHQGLTRIKDLAEAESRRRGSSQL